MNPIATMQRAVARIRALRAYVYLYEMALAASIAVSVRLRPRINAALANERGEITSQTIMIIILCTLAVAVGAIITDKVTAGANGISVP